MEKQVQVLLFYETLKSGHRVIKSRNKMDRACSTYGENKILSRI
jgi:hypothetical protein